MLILDNRVAKLYFVLSFSGVDTRNLRNGVKPLIVLSIGIWCVLVYSVRVAVFGNPLANLLLKKNYEDLQNAESAVQKGPAGMNSQDIHLVRRFSRLTLLELIVFLLEVGILMYLIFAQTLVWMCVAILAKDVVAMLLSVSCTRRASREGGLLTAFTNLPRWLHVADRISAAISAVGFIYLFLALNNILVPGANG